MVASNKTRVNKKPNTDVFVFAVQCPDCRRVHYLLGKPEERQSFQVMCVGHSKHFFLISDAKLLEQEILPEILVEEVKQEEKPAIATFK
jgi:hypothetical protein